MGIQKVSHQSIIFINSYMYSHVNCQSGSTRVLLSTLFTDKWLVLTMYHQVTLQMPSSDEGFVAVRMFANKWPFSSLTITPIKYMNANVNFELT